MTAQPDGAGGIDGAGFRTLGVEVLHRMPALNVAEAYAALEAALGEVLGRPPTTAEAWGIRRWVSHYPAAVDRVEEVVEVLRKAQGKPRRWADLVASVEGRLYLSFPLEPWERGAVRAAAAGPAMHAPAAVDLPEVAAAIVARARTRRAAA